MRFPTPRSRPLLILTTYKYELAWSLPNLALPCSRVTSANHVCVSCLVRMKLRNNMNVLSAATGSRTRMRQSDTKTRSTSVAIRGRAQRSLATIGRSTRPPAELAKPIPAATVAKSSSAQDVGPAQTHRGMPQTRTGMSVSGTCRKCTNFANATHPRSSSGRIISGSISSTATLALAANGPICLKTHA